MAKIQYQVNLPAKAANVANRELTITVGAGAPDVRPLPGDALVVKPLEGDVGATVKLSLVDVDAAGNRAVAVTASGVLAAATAAQPGKLCIST